MITPKNVLVATSITIVGAMFYLWGHSDGLDGSAFGLIKNSFAAEDSQELSPVKARP